MSTLAILLKESWLAVEDQADELAQEFYARLFVADPGLRELFPVEMTGQRSRFVQALVAVMQSVDEPERFDALLRALGRSHRRFHVEPQHYALVGTALLESLRSRAADQWSIEFDQAWRDVYDSMATRMLSGAEREATNPAFWPAEVIAHERRGRDVAVITCRPLLPYDFRAGQYACVESPHHPRMWRRYSIANAPRDGGTLVFHVRAPSDGFVSAALVRRLQVGDVIRIGPPMGAMILDEFSTRDTVCIAGGTGVAPITALVEEMARVCRSRWVDVFYGARTRDDLYGLPALQDLAARYPWLSVVRACSADPTYPGEQGTINEVVERYGPWRDHEFYVAGPPAMVRATLRTLSRAGVPQVRIRYDALTELPELGPTW